MKNINDTIREKAEKAVRQQSKNGRDDHSNLVLDEAKLIEELKIHQIELEMQNDELKKSSIRLAESQQSYFNLFQYAPLGYVIINDKTMIIDCNLHFMDMLEAGKGELIYHSITEFIHINDKKQFRLRFNSIIKLNKQKEIEIRFVSRKNKEYWVQLKFGDVPEHIIPEREKTKSHILVIVNDITTRKQSEIALVKAREAAENTAHQKAIFLARMSHELRTPLHGIIASAQIIQKDLATADISPQVLNRTNNLIHSGNNLARIVDDILNLSKLNMGQMVLYQEPFSLSELLLPLYDLFSLQTENNNIEFSLQNNVDRSVKFLGDSQRITQVLSNLLSNAFKFTERGKITLSVTFTNETRESCNLLFSVSDSGIGISNDFLQQIFDPFTQESLDIGKKYGGTGLGLGICQQILKLMDSQLQIQSTPGKGSVFSFTLKMETMNSGQISVDDNIAVLKQADKFDKQELRILLVDDNAINRDINYEMLRSIGYNQIKVVDDGYKAYDTYIESGNGYFDCILMDCEMPVMDGFQTTIKIRQFEQQQQWKAVVIIALSAHVLLSHVEKSKQSGMNTFLSKPISLKKLESTLQSI